LVSDFCDDRIRFWPDRNLVACRAVCRLRRAGRVWRGSPLALDSPVAHYLRWPRNIKPPGALDLARGND
jgi:hypothetical protein